MFARVELASIHALSTEVACRRQRGRSNKPELKRSHCGRVEVRITWVTIACVCAPVVAAVAVLGADVGVARVSHVAAVFHADLQTLGHVHVGHVGRRLAHTDTLTKKNTC